MTEEKNVVQTTETDEKKRSFGTLGDLKVKGLEVAPAGLNINIDPDFKIEALSDEEIAKSNEEIEVAKHLAQTLGRNQLTTEKELDRLLKAAPEWSLLPKDSPVRVQIEECQAYLGQFKAHEGTEFGVRKDFAKLMELVATATGGTETDTKTICRVVVDAGRFTKESYASIREIKKEKGGTYPPGVVFFPWAVYVSTLGEDSGMSKGQKGLREELYKLSERHKKSDTSKMEQAISANLAKFPEGKPGDYLFYSEPETGKGGKKRTEGHAHVRVEDINKGKKGRDPYCVVIVKKATGSLSWLEHQKRKSVPFFWIERNAVISKPEKMKGPEDVKEAEKLVWIIRKLHGKWVASQKKAKPAPPADKPEKKNKAEA